MRWRLVCRPCSPSLSYAWSKRCVWRGRSGLGQILYTVAVYRIDATYPRVPSALLVGRPTITHRGGLRDAWTNAALADDGANAAGRGAPAEVRP